ncbi:MAG: hypothetical protein CMJ80_01295 [Planctomycetaceae bacterium]|nr:hypothetical protein [Planctomycetaceae bacterium]
MSLTLSALKKLEDKGRFPQQPVAVHAKADVAWAPTSAPTEHAVESDDNADASHNINGGIGRAEKIRDDVESREVEVDLDALPPSTPKFDAESPHSFSAQDVPTVQLELGSNHHANLEGDLTGESSTKSNLKPTQTLIDTENEDTESWSASSTPQQTEAVQTDKSAESCRESMLQSAPSSRALASAEITEDIPTPDASPAYDPVIQPFDGLADDTETEPAELTASVILRDTWRQQRLIETPIRSTNDADRAQPDTHTDAEIAPVPATADPNVSAGKTEPMPAIAPTAHENSLLQQLDVAAHQQAFNDLLSAIEARCQFRFPESLVMCSPDESPRTADIIERLAILLSRSGLKTLILDAKVDAPTLSERFAAADAPGFTDFDIADNLELVRATSQERLYLLPVGRRVSAWSPNQDHLVSLLATLKSSFDCILVDAGTVSGRTLRIFGELCMASLLVVSCPDPTEKNLARAGKLLANLRAESLGCVVTDSDEPVPSLR